MQTKYKILLLLQKHIIKRLCCEVCIENNKNKLKEKSWKLIFDLSNFFSCPVGCGGATLKSYFFHFSSTTPFQHVMRVSKL